MIIFLIGYFRAKKHKVPFLISGHWQYYPQKIKGFKFLQFTESYTTGETVVDLLIDGKYNYQYLIVDVEYLSGSDWISSNREFSLRYVGRSLTNKDN